MFQQPFIPEVWSKARLRCQCLRGWECTRVRKGPPVTTHAKPAMFNTTPIMASFETCTIEVAKEPTTSSPTAAGILDRLRPSKPFSLARERKVSTNNKGSLQATFSKELFENCSPVQRTAQFPNEFLFVRSGKLYCDACRHELSLAKSIIKVDVASKKHQDSKANRAKMAEESKQLL